MGRRHCGGFRRRDHLHGRHDQIIATIDDFIFSPPALSRRTLTCPYRKEPTFRMPIVREQEFV
jgi:hypothetical protein